MSTVAQRSFASGEIAPTLYARVDLEKYVTSLRTCRNNIVMRHGGVSNRPGFYYVGELKDSSKTGRMIPFIFNSDQTYALIFGDENMRIVKDGAYVEVSGVSAWDSGTTYAIGDLVVESTVNYYCIAASTNNQPPNATYWYPLTGSIYEIPTPYDYTDLPTLNFDQSADVITLTHPSYAVRELARTADTTWVLSTVTFAPSQAAPTNLAVSGSGGTADLWVVTAINDETFEESLPPTAVGSDTVASSGSPRTLSWTLASGATNYNVYKKSNGIFGFIGVAAGTSFVDNGIAADTTETPPATRNPFSGSGNFPSTSAYYQQRHGYANTNNAPETCEFGKSANFKNFTRSTPLQNNDAVSFTLAANQVNEVQHMITLGKLIVMTTGGEWIIKGDDAGTLRIGEVNSEQISQHGCSTLRPLVIGNSALFVQNRLPIVRDLINDSIESWKSQDLTIFSTHLFDGKTIDDWSFQRVPDSVLWAKRSDGVMLGFTYIRDQKLAAWHRHDTDGTFENDLTIPENNEDALYVIVKRTINGSTVRYIERMTSRLFTDIKDAIYMDSALTYDGRHTGSTTMILSGGTDWTYEETLTLTASAGYFVVGDEGKEIHLTGSDGTILRFNIPTGGYSSGTVVTGKVNKTVPTTMRSAAISTWGKAVNAVSGLDHLEGENVSVIGDGFVEASPNNDAYDVVTVTSGAITLSEFYTVIHVGLPYISDLETLDIDTNESETLADKNKLITEVNVYLESSRGVFAGKDAPSDDTTDPLEGLYEMKIRDSEIMDDPVALKTGVAKIRIESGWNSNGRVFVRQVDPLPLNILAIMPAGYLPFRK